MSFVTTLYAEGLFLTNPKLRVLSTGEIYILDDNKIIHVDATGKLVKAIKFIGEVTLGNHINRGSDNLLVVMYVAGEGTYRASIDTVLGSVNLSKTVEATEYGFYGDHTVITGIPTQLHCGSRVIAGVRRTVHYRTRLGETFDTYFRHNSYLIYPNIPIAFLTSTKGSFTVIRCNTSDTGEDYVYTVSTKQGTADHVPQELYINEEEFERIELYPCNYADDIGAFVTIVGSLGYTSYIIKHNRSPEAALSHTEGLIFLASDTSNGVYVSVELDGVFYLRKYTQVYETETSFIINWTKRIDILGVSGDFICSGEVVGTTLTLILRGSSNAIYILQVPTDCVRNGVYGDITISTGSTTDIGRSSPPTNNFISNVTTTTGDSYVGTEVTFKSVYPIDTSMSVHDCDYVPPGGGGGGGGSGDLPSFTDLIQNRDAMRDVTNYWSKASDTDIISLPLGVTTYTTSLQNIELFVRHLQITVTTSTACTLLFAIYDTEGTQVGGDLDVVTYSSGITRTIYPILLTGYGLSYIVIYKQTTCSAALTLKASIPTWSFPPQTNYGEIREYLTDISNSKESELRAALRELPRTTLRYSSLFKTTPEFVQAKFVSEASVDGFISVPLWMDLTRVTNLILGDTIINLTNLYHEWTIGTKVIVWGDYTTYEVSEIAASSLTSITIADPLLRDYSVAYVMPLLTGVVPTEINFQFSNNNRTADFTLLSTETYFEEAFTSPFIDLDGTILTDEFGEFLYPEVTDFIGYPILEGTLLNDGNSISHNRESYLNDNEIGLLSKTDNELYTRENSNVVLIARTAEEIYLLKRKLDSLQGKFFAFWLPTKENDIRFSFTSLTSGDTSFIVTFNQLSITKPKYLHIIGDTEVVVKIASISNNYDGTETITLLSALTTDILAITRIEVVHLMRSATDSFELRYFNRNKAIVNFPVTSVNL